MGKTTHRSLGELGWNTIQERLGENRVGIPHIEPRRMTLEASGNSCGDARQENPGELIPGQPPPGPPPEDNGIFARLSP